MILSAEKHLLHFSKRDLNANDQRQKAVEVRNRRLAWKMFVLCLCFTIFTLPQYMYGYIAQPRYDQRGDIMYTASLGVYWLHFVFNVSFYLTQQDQYRKAYKDYIQEKILPFIYKKTETTFHEESNLATFDAKKQKVQLNLSLYPALSKDILGYNTSTSFPRQ